MMATEIPRLIIPTQTLMDNDQSWGIFKGRYDTTLNHWAFILSALVQIYILFIGQEF